MRAFKDRVAVVTGAGSGIGRAIARQCAREGMKVALADIDPKALRDIEGELQAAGASTLATVTDVAKAADMETLGRRVVDTFGAVHLLCNNAGVLHVAPFWDNSVADWEWVLGVNLWGTIHGLRVFVPLMRAQDAEAQIVNVASTAAFNTGSGLAPYKVSKHAVLALSEVLYHELAEDGAKVKVSVLCPSWVNTGIMDADRNRPGASTEGAREDSAGQKHHRERGRQSARAGASPEQVAEAMFQGIREERFYILPHDDFKERFRKRADDILGGRNPASRPARP